MEEEGATPRRGPRRLLTVLAVVAAVAAVPAGVALAGGSDQPSGIEAQSGPDASQVQSTAPDRGDGQRGHDREDCPEKDQGAQGSSQEGTTEL